MFDTALLQLLGELPGAVPAWLVAWLVTGKRCDAVRAGGQLRWDVAFPGAGGPPPGF